MSSQRPSEVGKRNLRGNAWVSFLGFGSIRAELNPRKLQRGRATGGAEFDTDGGHGGQRASASTGPRHGGRGIMAREAAGVTAKQVLQRGRATGGAEFQDKNAAKTLVSQLQRGRATGGAEFA